MARLTIVPTPIGNLQDITLRAVEVLRSCDLILAEDTRTSLKLLNHLGIKKPLESHHKFNEFKTSENVVKKIKSGMWVALISDAGTPGINDPGSILVKQCIQEGVEVECLPGPTAFVPALVSSGIDTSRFCYEGFLPLKKGRKTRWEHLSEEERTIILYESPHRVVKALKEAVEYLGENRLGSVTREISKIHEEHLRGTTLELLRHFETTPSKGEFVLIFEGKSKRTSNSEE